MGGNQVQLLRRPSTIQGSDAAIHTNHNIEIHLSFLDKPFPLSYQLVRHLAFLCLAMAVTLALGIYNARSQPSNH